MRLQSFALLVITVTSIKLCVLQLISTSKSNLEVECVAPPYQTAMLKNQKENHPVLPHPSSLTEACDKILEVIARGLVSLECMMQRGINLLPTAKAMDVCNEPLISKKKCVQITTNSIRKLNVHGEEASKFTIPIQISCEFIDELYSVHKKPTIEDCEKNVTLKHWNFTGDFALRLTAREAEALTVEITPGPSHKFTTGTFSLMLSFDRFCIQLNGNNCTNCSDTTSCNQIKEKVSKESYERNIIIHYELKSLPKNNYDNTSIIEATSNSATLAIVIPVAVIGIAAVAGGAYLIIHKKKALKARSNDISTKERTDVDKAKASNPSREQNNSFHTEISNNNNIIDPTTFNFSVQNASNPQVDEDNRAYEHNPK